VHEPGAALDNRHGAHRRVEPEILDSYFAPITGDVRVRRDVNKVLRDISNRYTLEVVQSFLSFRKPVLLAWSEDYSFFPFRVAERLQRAFPDAQLERIAGSRAFVPEDQPRLLAELTQDFLEPRTDVENAR
jgi:pimeloyl-ACP methyl ester carboxylesterase